MVTLISNHEVMGLQRYRLTWNPSIDQQAREIKDPRRAACLVVKVLSFYPSLVNLLGSSSWAGERAGSPVQKSFSLY